MAGHVATALTLTLSRRERGCNMLAKLKTFSLVGIDAVPVEVEVMSRRRPAQGRAGRPAGTGGQGEHAPARAGDGQLGFSAAAEPRGHQPRPGVFPPVTTALVRKRRDFHSFQTEYSRGTVGHVGGRGLVVISRGRFAKPNGLSRIGEQRKQLVAAGEEASQVTTFVNLVED